MQHGMLVFLDLWLDVIQKSQIYILFAVKKSDLKEISDLNFILAKRMTFEENFQIRFLIDLENNF